MNEYSFWTDEKLHLKDDQQTRQYSALNKKLTPYEVYVSNKMCRIKGTGKEAYEVYLEECTCRDFAVRKLPCKHMYRLAHELSVFQLDGTPETLRIVTSF